MDASLADLLGALEKTQQAKSVARLSERNVVELISKLKQLGILGDELLHTINGKEYITTDRLKADIKVALAQAGGRLEVVELPALVGVDLVHCERQISTIISESNGSVVEAQGELMTTQYFDSLAAEINELLQESGVITLGDLAVQYSLNTELLISTISARVGAIIKGHLESGLLYTQAYVRNIKAQLRGALRAIAAPVTMPSVVKELGLEGVGGGGGTSMVSSLIDELVKEQAVAGTLKGGGINWTPACYATAQQEAATSFYNQNGWVAYETVRKMGIPNEKAFLKGKYPDGIALETSYVSAVLLDQVETAVEEAVAGGSWTNIQPLLPPALTAADCQALLSKCALLKEAEGKGRQQQLGRKALLLAASCVVSGAFLQQLQQQVEQEARAAADQALLERRRSSAGGASTSGAAAASSSRKGKGADGDDEEDEDWSMGTGKKGKKGKGAAKGKSKAGSKQQASSSASGKQRGGDSSSSGAAAEILQTDSLAAKLAEWHPDLDGAGESEDLATALAELLRPAAVAAYETALQAALTAGAEERRRAKDAAVKALEDAHQRLQLYGNGAQLLQADEATHSTVLRHVVRTTGAETLDALLRWAALEFVNPELGQEAAEQLAAPLAPAERVKLVRALPADVSAPLQQALELLTGADVAEVAAKLEAAAEACGVRLRKLDKKAEKAAVASHRARLQQVLEGEGSPAAALQLLVPLLFAKVHGRLLSLPGRALAGVLQLLQPALAEPVYAAVLQFHDGVVESLKMVSQQQQVQQQEEGEEGGGGDGGARLGELNEKLLADLTVVKELVVAGGGGSPRYGGKGKQPQRAE